MVTELMTAELSGEPAPEATLNVHTRSGEVEAVRLSCSVQLGVSPCSPELPPSSPQAFNRIRLSVAAAIRCCSPSARLPVQAVDQHYAHP